ncbi:MAG TPA: hypothetical protein VKR06_44810 [Ktedonosporobacter sp.]|nr:hypothetical protein [Ktedonosporobacter sp.]
MNLGSLWIKALVIIVLLILLSLAGAITFPALSILTGSTTAGVTGILFLLAAMLILSTIGSLIGKGIKTFKKPLESVLLAFIGAFFMGAALALSAILNIPYTAHVNFTWLGSTWYGPILTLLFIGAPLMMIFLVVE